MRKLILALGTFLILAAGGTVQGMRDMPLAAVAPQFGSTNIP